jgi:uncharacterized protein with PQ loop repeat
MYNTLLNVLPMFSTAFLLIFYMIQIGKTVKTKNVEGVSFLGWFMLNAALAFMFVNALMIFIKFHTYGYLVTESANLLLALIELTFILIYRKKGTK